MRREGMPIRALLLRVFLPVVVASAVLLAALVYNLLYAAIIEGFDRKLVTTSALAGAMIDPREHDVLLRAARQGGEAAALERTPEYLGNVRPLRRIRRELDLTYVYTQAIGGDADIVYILDGTEGEDHSPIGFADDLPDETVAGLRLTEASGTIYVSPIEYQEQWGLLKTAAAPVYGSDGRVTSTAGADVNISVIQVGTQNALFASAMVGIASVLACLLVALVAVRRVAEPITAVKDEALRIASGDPRPPAAIRSPREVAELRDDLAGLVEKIAAETQAAQDDDARWGRAANAALLAGTGEDRPVLLLDDPQRRVLWIGADDPGCEAALARRAMRQLAERFASDPRLKEHWLALADSANGSCILVDKPGKMLEVAGRPVCLRTADGEAPLRSGEPVAFGPGAVLVAGGREYPLDDGAAR